MSIVVVATIIPIAEHRDEVLAVLTETIEKVQTTDAGCELYALHQAKDRFVMIEKWADGEALKTHGGGEAMAALTAGLEGKLVTEIDVKILRPVPVGTAEQGSV